MKYQVVLLGLLACWQVGAAAECQRPSPPAELDALESRDRQAMLTAQSQVTDYLAGADAYLDCLDEMDAAATDADSDIATAAQRARIAAYSRVMAEMNATADSFSEQVRRFNQR